MIKSRICILVTFVLMMISSVCFAGDRWFVLYEDNIGSILLDTTQVIAYKTDDKKGYYLDCWVQTNLIKGKDSFTAKEHMCIECDTLKYKLIASHTYKNGTYVGNSPKGWQNTVPGTYKEETVNKTIDWTKINVEKLIFK